MRPCLVLILLLGLASPVIAQTPNIPGDTAQGGDGPRMPDSLYSTNAAGFAAGFMRWPADLYCGGRASAAATSLDPSSLLDRIQLASRCGVRLVIVPPRRFLTTTGRTQGAFSVDSAKRLIDRYAEVLPADTLRKYRGAILGLNLGDDYGCTRCWGGSVITQAQIAEWASYARTRLPGVPLGVRVTPQWVAADSALAPLLDYAWAQYHTGKGGPREYYDKAATAAERLGLRMVMGVNVKDCYGVGTSACSVEDLTRLGRMAMSHPASCAFINWRFDGATWKRAEIREAWERLMAVARNRRAEECRRTG